MHWIVLAVVLIHECSARRQHQHLFNVTASQMIENQDENDLIGTGVQFHSYNKHHPGRHVCTTNKNITYPIKTKESYCKPVYKHYQLKCNQNQICKGVRLEYEIAYRDVVLIKSKTQVTYVCCPGWHQAYNWSHGCNKPRCSVQCQNGGRCSRPDVCSCPKGFAGDVCEKDVDECKETKPCDQMCHNTLGSYKCQCRENFVLQSDGQSCKKEGDSEEPGLEAKDLEYESLDKRLFKIEKVILQSRTGEMSSSELKKITKKVEGLSVDVNILKNKIVHLEALTRDHYLLKNNWNLFSIRASKLKPNSIKVGKSTA